MRFPPDQSFTVKRCVQISTVCLHGAHKGPSYQFTINDRHLWTGVGGKATALGPRGTSCQSPVNPTITIKKIDQPCSLSVRLIISSVKSSSQVAAVKRGWKAVGEGRGWLLIKERLDTCFYQYRDDYKLFIRPSLTTVSRRFINFRDFSGYLSISSLSSKRRIF